MRMYLGLAIAGCALSVSTVALAQGGDILSPGRFAVGATVGTDGAGGDLEYKLSRFITLRGRGTWLDVRFGGNSGDVRYGADFKLSQGGGFADLHPFANPFVVSVGAVAGPRRADVTLHYRRNVRIGGTTYTPDQLGQGGGSATLASPAPFVGLGFDNTFTHAGHWGFKLTAGVAFSHPPDVSLAPTSGLAAQYPALIAPYVATVAHDIRRDGQVFAYYPQISTGVTYRF